MYNPDRFFIRADRKPVHNYRSDPFAQKQNSVLPCFK